MDPARKKRRFHRYRCSLPIELRRYGHSYPLRSTTNALSGGGCYVNLTSALRIGTPLDVILWAGESKLEFRGIVRSSDSNTGNGVAGNGIEFTEITDEQRINLQRYLDQIKAQICHPAFFFR